MKCVLARSLKVMKTVERNVAVRQMFHRSTVDMNAKKKMSLLFRKGPLSSYDIAYAHFSGFLFTNELE